MSLIFALAGSASNSHGLLCSSDGSFLALHPYPGIHLREIHQRELTEHLERIVSCVAQEANISENELRSRCTRLSLALSGTDHRFDKSPLLGSFKQIGLGVDDQSLSVSGLAEAIYRAVLGGQPGLVVRAGIGFSVFGGNQNGEHQLASALTTILGAPGSAYTLGLALFNIMRHYLDQLSSPDEASIARSLLKLWQLEQPVEFFDRVQSIRLEENGDNTLLKELSDASEVLFLEARQGNPEARRLIAEVSTYQTTMVKRIASKLGLRNAGHFQIVFHGSLFSKHPELARAIFDDLRENLFHARELIEDRTYFAPVIGAAKIAFSPEKFQETSQSATLLASIESLSPYQRQQLTWTPISLQRKPH